ncbi:class I SAM-dependent methyltransferase [Prosthecobacter sp. SYSU 5D2]|uniref:class I SAM-dependent methyltransferase n=1 Tax=Prosthecobacter sp. SYSU 5D2 TaxID=3134134 RepID=UPI0031FECB70
MSYPKSTPSVEAFNAALANLKRSLSPNLAGKTPPSSKDYYARLQAIPLLIWWGERKLANAYAQDIFTKETESGWPKGDELLELELTHRFLTAEDLMLDDVVERLLVRIEAEVAELQSPRPNAQEVSSHLKTRWLAGQLSSYELGRGGKALLGRGEHELAGGLLKMAAQEQREDGTYPSLHQSGHTCLKGLLEMASAWFRAGDLVAGERAFGAFLKSFGKGQFFSSPTSPYAGPEALIHATTFLETLRDRVTCTFEATAMRFPKSIASDDGRFKIVDELVAKHRPKVVADIGCGKGRFIRLLKERYPEINAIAVDLSTTMLEELPSEITARQGTLLNTSLATGSVDLVFCVEALEHALNTRAGVQELARITAPSGVLVIIDKDVKKLGTLQICDWEQWFDREVLSGWMKEEGFRVTVLDRIDHGGISGEDRLFLAWVGENSQNTESQRTLTE